jgi:hypothetical protein
MLTRIVILYSKYTHVPKSPVLVCPLHSFSSRLLIFHPHAWLLKSERYNCSFAPENSHSSGSWLCSLIIIMSMKRIYSHLIFTHIVLGFHMSGAFIRRIFPLNSKHLLGDWNTMWRTTVNHCMLMFVSIVTLLWVLVCKWSGKAQIVC